MSRLVEEYMEELDEQIELDLKAYQAAGTAVAFYLLHKRFTYITMNLVGGGRISKRQG